jgi:hypothetical protein
MTNEFGETKNKVFNRKNKITNSMALLVFVEIEFQTCVKYVYTFIIV